MKYWLEDEHTVCFVSESGFSRVAFNFLNSSITRGPPIPFNFLKYWLTFNLISSTVEKSTFLSSSTALLSWRPSVVPTKDMMKFLTHARAWHYWKFDWDFCLWLYKEPYLDDSGTMYGLLVYHDELLSTVLRYLHFFHHYCDKIFV